MAAACPAIYALSLSSLSFLLLSTISQLASDFSQFISKNL
ncbi:hypothetical protein ANO14919_021890 [Xylariales sp. No.14919]|nr:hypothetical protein ANO14919_021890 [Xylariales sp. No.14919]